MKEGPDWRPSSLSDVRGFNVLEHHLGYESPFRQKMPRKYEGRQGTGGEGIGANGRVTGANVIGPKAGAGEGLG